ncbi:hypothetical protein C1H46_033768 [Malus baccata]|uniref:Anaphase-promoting complex subunit 5 domain-containing protein n=1 Tax=Malus baccata TaxID=106549 RepID=A0A540L2W0_MALBA|nr:hypothetical protein C1H46_033768 [Malus baccata]
MFLRRCILAFNLLSFVGASHLLTSIEMYCKEAISSYPPYESLHLDDSSNDLETPPEYENLELENLVFEKVTEEIEARQRAGGSEILVMTGCITTLHGFSCMSNGMLLVLVTYMKISLIDFGGLSSSDTTLAYLKLIQHLAVFKGYKEDFATLVEIAAAKFLSVSKSRILLLKLQLLHEHALHRGHLKFAQQVCDELGVLASSVSGMDMELKTEASLRNARTLLAANQFSEKSGNAVLGLPYALASLLFCQSFNLDLLKASATLTLAELWLSLGSSHAKMALSLVHGAFPMILGRGGLELRARAFIVEAKCYLSDPSFSISGSFDDVLDYLRQASNELQSIARVGTPVNGCENASGVQYHKLAAEAFYLMAMVFDKLGRIEDAAASFKQHILALENPQDEEDPLIF